MSGLARLLAGHTDPGVYHWASAAEPDVVEHAVERAGWRYVGLDTWQVEDKAGFLQACKSAFGIEDLAEHSFDGLADALNEVEAGESAGVVVFWAGWAPFARADRQAFDVAIDVFDARVDTERRGAFAVLLQGTGPQTDLAELDLHHSEP
jgi:barstar (barnase inhibitor)